MRAQAQPKPRSGGDVLRAYALYHVDVAGRALGCDAARLHTGIHEARKAMRRARAALDLRASIADSAVGSDELKLLCRRLSVARDAYIIVKTIEKFARSHASGEQGPAFRKLLERFARRHQRQIARLRQLDPAMRKLRARLTSLRTAIAALDWPAFDETGVRQAISATARKAERAASAARAEETGETRHRWRRRLRRLRYQIELGESELGIAAGAAAGRGETSAARIAKMTDLLGDEHDLRLVLEAIESPRSAAPRADDFAAVKRLLHGAISQKVGALRP